MDSPSFGIYPRSTAAAAALPIRPSAPFDKFLGERRPPPAPAAQAMAPSTVMDDPDPDEFDEEELWGLEEALANKKDMDASALPPSPLPPRTAVPSVVGRARTGGLSLAFEGRSPFREPKGLLGISSVSAAESSFWNPCRRVPAAEVASRYIPAASRMIPRTLIPHEGIATHRGGVEDAAKQLVAQSAPVNIPDWSKCRGAVKENAGALVDNAGVHVLDNASVQEKDEDEEEEERLPPHEFLAREYARSGVTSFSMCEGAGRTLKGRDLSSVRNAVLARTGFLD